MLSSDISIRDGYFPQRNRFADPVVVRMKGEFFAGVTLLDEGSLSSDIERIKKDGRSGAEGCRERREQIEFSRISSSCCRLVFDVHYGSAVQDIQTGNVDPAAVNGKDLQL